MGLRYHQKRAEIGWFGLVRLTSCKTSQPQELGSIYRLIVLGTCEHFHGLLHKLLLVFLMQFLCLCMLVCDVHVQSHAFFYLPLLTMVIKRVALTSKTGMNGKNGIQVQPAS